MTMIVPDAASLKDGLTCQDPPINIFRQLLLCCHECLRERYINPSVASEPIRASKVDVDRIIPQIVSLLQSEGNMANLKLAKGRLFDHAKRFRSARRFPCRCLGRKTRSSIRGLSAACASAGWRPAA